MTPEEYLCTTRELLGELEWDQIEYVLAELRSCRDRDGRLFLVGNGGGAGYASHAASDFRKFGGLQAWSYDNLTELTARINDEGWESCVIDWLKASRCTENDLLLVFSVGGSTPYVSRNLMEGIKSAPCPVVGLVGIRGGALREYADVNIIIPTDDTAQVESVQAVLFHLLATCL